MVETMTAPVTSVFLVCIAVRRCGLLLSE